MIQNNKKCYKICDLYERVNIKITHCSVTPLLRSAAQSGPKYGMHHELCKENARVEISYFFKYLFHMIFSLDLFICTRLFYTEFICTFLTKNVKLNIFYILLYQMTFVEKQQKLYRGTVQMWANIIL